MNRIPLDERPRERLLTSGFEALSNRELIAVLLGSGTKGKSVLELADELLTYFGGLKGVLNATLPELSKIKGMGQAKSLQLLAAAGLAKRILKMASPISGIVADSQAAFDACRDIFFGLQKEILVVLLLDSSLALIHREIIGMGTLTEVLVHPREIFHVAIKHCAHSIILAHNHPSGDLTPSKADQDLTKKLLQAAELLDISILDHLIIAGERYFSLMKYS